MSDTTPIFASDGADQVLADIDRVLEETVAADVAAELDATVAVTPDGVFGLPGFTLESGADRVLAAAGPDPSRIRGASVEMCWVDEAAGDAFTSHVDQYAVGLLHDIRVRQLRSGLRYVGRQAANGKWRSVRSYFRNGWLTEHAHPCWHTAGWGWSRKRSTRRADAACRAAIATTEGKV